MLRTILPPALALALPSLALAQFDTVDVAWERALSSPTYGGFHPIEVEPVVDGGALVVGLARQLPLSSFDRPGDMVLIKLSENGDVQWTDTLDSPPFSSSSFIGGRFADAVADAQGNSFVVVARSGANVLRAYDSSGTVLWEETLQTRGVTGASGWSDYNTAYVALQPNGDVVTCGMVTQGTYPRADVRVFGPDGTPRWEWRGDGGSDQLSTAYGYPLGVKIAPNGNVILHGQSDGPAFPFVGQVTALDSAGTFLWKRTIDGTGGVGPLVFDSQGDAVVLGPAFLGFSLFRVSMTGDLTTLVTHSEAGYQVIGTCLALDAFDRISVGGSRRQDGFGAREATLFSFDPAGAFLRHSIPSVQGAAQDGSFEQLHVTTRNDVVAFGSSRSGIDEIILARFAPDGTERWSRRRRGVPPQASGSTAVGLGLAVDPRGNLFTLAETVESGTFPNQVLGLDLAKHVQNGPVSDTYCGPAQPNSTGAPASIRALGPRLASVDNLTLRADDLPPGALTLLLASRAQGNVPNVGGGQGTLCLGGSIGRFFGPGQVRVADAAGTAALQLDLNDLPQPNGSVPGMAGESWNFQGWYRDANPSATSNLTDGVRVTLQ